MAGLKSILLVEDNLNDAELVLNALKRNNFASGVVTARHGGEALDYLFRRGNYVERKADHPLFILLDIKMPLVDGLEVLQQLKSDETLKVIPVVMLTSSGEETDVIRSYRLGANAYIVKPVNFSEFIETIRQLSTFWAAINHAPPNAAFLH